MGSLSGNGVPVVSKNPYAFTNQDGRQIVRTNSVDDTDTVRVNNPPDRLIGSGSIVRADGSVVYTENRVWGVYEAGRSTSDRVASKAGNTRDLDVELGDNQTIAVIPGALSGTNPQTDVRHTGNRVTVHNSIGDALVRRASDSGTYGS